MAPPPPWPPISFEERNWHPSAIGPVSRRQSARRRQPYRAAVVPAIATATVQLPNDIAASADDASIELARFDATMGGEIAPFTSVLLRSESAASSQIEHLTASARAIAEAELGIRRAGNAAMVVANSEAMRAAIALAQHIDEHTILAMHEALMRSAPHVDAGRWRTEQVWIGGSAHGPHDADFVPPHHDHVPSAIADLLEYVRRTDVPVLVQAALAHAQFESIHPFTDGNGRTGRALLQTMLRNKGLTRNVTVPISAGLLTDTAAYFGALDACRAGDPGPIVAQVAEASLRAIANGALLVDELRSLRVAWTVAVRARRHSRVWAVVELLFEHPVVNASFVADRLGLAVPNVYPHLDALERAGIVVEFTDKRRNRVWRAPAILDALDAFAARVGRRSGRSP